MPSRQPRTRPYPRTTTAKTTIGTSHHYFCNTLLRGRLVVEVDGQRISIGPGEFCCFPHGVFHAIVETYPPIESLMIRAPSVNDKVYLASDSGEKA
jgi:mannose-6-phosphate isomerase-like protein (cupin superfamily)